MEISQKFVAFSENMIFNPRTQDVTCDFGKARIFDKSRQADRSVLHQEAKYGQVINLFGFAFSFFDYYLTFKD